MMSKIFQQETWFVDAMNYLPVWKILMTVKADPSVANIVHVVNKYADKFLDMDDNMLGVVVTHMDKVSWTPGSCVKDLKEQLGITDVVFSSTKELGSILQSKIPNMATIPQETMDGDINEANHCYGKLGHTEALRGSP